MEYFLWTTFLLLSSPFIIYTSLILYSWCSWYPFTRKQEKVTFHNSFFVLRKVECKMTAFWLVKKNNFAIVTNHSLHFTVLYLSEQLQSSAGIALLQQYERVLKQLEISTFQALLRTHHRISIGNEQNIYSTFHLK